MMPERSWTEMEMQNYIKMSIPGIGYEDLWKIRNRFVYDSIPLDIAVAEYAMQRNIERWNKSKDKHYYRVHKPNGAVKYMYACEEHVKHMCECDNYEYEKVG